MVDYNALTASLNEAWSSVIGDTGEQELRAVFILGDLIAGFEAGFELPPAGGDAKWLEEHYRNFERKAHEGDEDFADLVKELEERRDLKAALEG